MEYIMNFEFDPTKSDSNKIKHGEILLGRKKRGNISFPIWMVISLDKLL